LGASRVRVRVSIIDYTGTGRVAEMVDPQISKLGGQQAARTTSADSTLMSGA